VLTALALYDPEAPAPEAAGASEAGRSGRPLREIRITLA
jgi:hypothetical protein